MVKGRCPNSGRHFTYCLVELRRVSVGLAIEGFSIVAKERRGPSGPNDSESRHAFEPTSDAQRYGASLVLSPRDVACSYILGRCPSQIRCFDAFHTK